MLDACCASNPTRSLRSATRLTTALTPLWTSSLPAGDASSSQAWASLGIIARKIAATFSSTGTPAYFLHPAEAVHGDLGVIRPDDLLLALSHSGETPEILRLLETIKRLGVKSHRHYWNGVEHPQAGG